MDRTDHNRWASARTLLDLGELTACWLEGRLASLPGYVPDEGPDEDLRPLMPVLTRLNRLGYVMTGAQPGRDSAPGFDGALWQSRAAIEGVCRMSTAVTLSRYARENSLHVTQYDARYAFRRWPLRSPRLSPVVVTERALTPHTWFGCGLDRITSYAEECGPAAREALKHGVLVTIADPRYGDHDSLWQFLDQFLVVHAQPQ
jgi:hypothetical protein